MNKTDVKLKDFQPCNEWTQHPPDEYYVTDQSTGRRYATFSFVRGHSLKESSLRGMFLFTSFGVLPALTCILNLVARVGMLITGYHLWKATDDKNYTLKDRCIEVGLNLAAIIATPLTLIALEVSALYGIISPLNGRKLYASTERFCFLYIGFPSIQPMHLSSPVSNIWNASLEEDLGAHKMIKEATDIQKEATDIQDLMKTIEGIENLPEKQRKAIEKTIKESGLHEANLQDPATREQLASLLKSENLL